jgi:hypothetical protein
MAGAKEGLKTLSFGGKLITAIDPLELGSNFQQLQNLRYTDSGVRGVGGMSKINSSALTTYTLVRSAFHYQKDQPIESHLVVQAFNSGETASRLFVNNTSVPSTGDYEAAELYVEDADAVTGSFVSTPDGKMVYCNGAESLIWGGDESRVAGFVNFDSQDQFLYNFTDRINNILTDSNNTATLSQGGGGLDANVMLMLSLNNNVTDSSLTTPHTVTNNGVTFSTDSKFGSHAASFDGTNDNLSIPDNADFNFSSGEWSIDFWIKANSSTADGDVIYRQETDANNYFTIRVRETAGGRLRVYLTVVAASSIVFEINSPGFLGDAISGAYTYHHIYFGEADDTWYFGQDGAVYSITDTDRAANYTGVVRLGYNGTGNYFAGLIDEFRVSNVARWTSNPYTVPSLPYSVSNISNVYLGSLVQLDGFKVYVETANLTASSLVVQYWDGAEWVAVSGLSDGTAAGGVTLAQTGEVSFTSTVGLAKASVLDWGFLYWYRLLYTEVDETTEISQVTLKAPVQPLVDIWDGTQRIAHSFLKFNAVSYLDLTINVADEDHSSANTATYADISSLATIHHLLVGSLEPLSGVVFKFAEDKVNTANTNLTVEYWNGSDWVVTTGTVDKTANFTQSGVVSWTAVADGSEFTKSVVRDIPLYYYKISFDANLSTNVHLDHVTCIPAQKQIGSYLFPLHAHNRTWLCSEQSGLKNRAIVSASGTSQVFNGTDSTAFDFGNTTALTAGGVIYGQYGSNLYDLAVFCKSRETWVVSGNNPLNWTQFQVSDNVGCVAPKTMVSCHLTNTEVEGLSKHLLIWQAMDGVYLFDGRTLHPIHGDIKNFFELSASDKLNPSMASKSSAFFDPREQEYHWLFASGTSTTLNREFVFNVKKFKWFEIQRTTGKRLQLGLAVKDSNNNPYTYGFIDTGYTERLENSNTFDGSGIEHSVWFGEQLLTGSLYINQQVREVLLAQVAKSSGEVTLSHYGNSSTTAETVALSCVNGGYRLAKKGVTCNFGPQNLSSFKLSITTSDQTIGFEPLALSIYYKDLGLTK